MIPAPLIAETLVVDFESTPLGEAPVGFITSVTGEGPAGRWIVQDDPEAPSGARVLAQTSADPRTAQFPLAIYSDFSAADVDLSVRFRPISGKTDQAAGLVWRYLDENNYYVVRANALEGNVVLYKVHDGERADLPLVGQGRTYGAQAAVPADTWSVLGLQAKGDRFTVSLNGAERFEVQDRTFEQAGRVGLWTKADSVSGFDDLTITTFP
ncbi:MAG: hypothetical protein H0T41_11745 [Rhodobacteraceae bacterium]|nr:hypothetical protein [Paracoccaceae bacterium]